MTFQFQCPSGHLLQAEPEQSGQKSQCPVCGMLMIVPPAPAKTATLAQPSGLTRPQAPPTVPRFERDQAVKSDFFVETGSKTGPDAPADVPSSKGSPIVDIGDVATPDVYHIPCPNGHELETPAEMIGQYVMCPTCSSQFQLSEQDSIEYRRKKQIERDAREAKTERSWLNWAIAIVVLVLLGLATLIAASILSR